MNFTGERYVPSLKGQIRYEHLHRYALATACVAGKVVLDIASGEGYGSALMAPVARRVIGVDIDLSSVCHARRHYQAHPNLQFVAGSCAAIPLPDGYVDAIISFETIEHHDQHQAMIGEIKRTLRPGGLLIISSPNRLVYSDLPKYINPFHVKELYLDEFHGLLRQYFRSVKIYGQRIATGSFVYELEHSARTTLHGQTSRAGRLEERVPSLDAPTYFIAFCSDGDLHEAENAVSVFLDSDDDILKMEQTVLHQKLAELNVQLVEQERAGQALRAQLEGQTRQLQAQLAEKVQQVNTQETRLAELAQSLRMREAQAAELASQADQLSAELKAIQTSRLWRLGQVWYSLRQAARSMLRTRPVSDASDDWPSPSPHLDTANPEIPQNEPLPIQVLFISHDAHRHGAQLILLNLLRWLRANSDLQFEVLLKSDGELRPEFEALAPVHVWPAGLGSSPRGPRQLEMLFRQSGLAGWLRPRPARQQTAELTRRWAEAKVQLVYSNTVTNGYLLANLASLRCPVICHVHELSYWITQRTEPGNNDLVKAHTTHFIAASQAVKRSLQETLQVPEGRIDVIYEFAPSLRSLPPQTGVQVRARLGISAEAWVVGASGTTDWRKGPDIFIQLAQAIRRRASERPVHFLWVGGDRAGPHREALQYDVTRAGLEGCLHFIGAVPNPLDYFAAFDVFVLTSREDPFPVVTLEAASLGKPVVCFDGSGGAKEFVEEDCGFVIPYLDVEAMAQRVLELLRDPDLRERLGGQGREKVRSRHDVEVIAPQVLKIIRRVLAAAGP